MQAELTEHAVKAAPPLAVSGLSVMGLPLSEWVYVLTAIYIAFQIVLIVPKVIRLFRGK